jgi:hypothetical protein
MQAKLKHPGAIATNITENSGQGKPQTRSGGLAGVHDPSGTQSRRNYPSGDGEGSLPGHGGHPHRLTPRSTDDNAPINGVIWSHNGDRLVYNRYVSGPEGRYNQVFQLMAK